jgi:hypothetical protein
MRLLGEAIQESGPVFNAIVGDALQADIGGRAEQPLLQVLPKSIVDSEGDHERSHAGGNSSDGDCGDNANESLAPLGAEIAAGDKQFEAHA